MKIDKILSNLLVGEINKKETEELLLNHFSDYYTLHSDLKEGENIIYKGNSGKLIEIGGKKSTIKYSLLGYVENAQSTFEKEVYNIEFYKTPKGYWN